MRRFMRGGGCYKQRRLVDVNVRFGKIRYVYSRYAAVGHGDGRFNSLCGVYRAGKNRIVRAKQPICRGYFAEFRSAVLFKREYAVFILLKAAPQRICGSCKPPAQRVKFLHGPLLKRKIHALIKRRPHIIKAPVNIEQRKHKGREYAYAHNEAHQLRKAKPAGKKLDYEHDNEHYRRHYKPEHHAFGY